MFCKKCGFKVDDECRFCPQCGAPLEPMHQDIDAEQLSLSDPAYSGKNTVRNAGGKASGKRWIVMLGLFVVLVVVIGAFILNNEDMTYIPDEDGSHMEPITESENKADEEEYTEDMYSSDVDWSFIEDTYTDGRGYTYNLEIMISPWMLKSSNAEMIESAWSEVGNGRELPEDMTDWGLNDGSRQVPSGNTQAAFIHQMNDMYYCIGTIKITNATEGFSFSDNNKGNYNPIIFWNMERISKYTSADIISRTYYSDSSEDAPCICASPVMTSDEWGPVPFVAMAPENFTPNNPEGEFFESMKNGFFNVQYGNDFTVAIYGKDGEYYESDN